jgi:hypothetical protein
MRNKVQDKKIYILAKLGELATKASVLNPLPRTPVNTVFFATLEEANKPEGQQPGKTPLAPPTTLAPETPNVAEQIRLLGELRDAGLIKTADYEAKKAELLARM